jgi:hypothetical protein
MLKHRVRRIERDAQTFRSCLERGEDLVEQAAPEDECLVYIEALGREGYFDSEPDFPTALAPGSLPTKIVSPPCRGRRTGWRLARARQTRSPTALQARRRPEGMGRRRGGGADPPAPGTLRRGVTMTLRAIRQRA